MFIKWQKQPFLFELETQTFGLNVDLLYGAVEWAKQCTVVRFASFISGGFTSMAVIKQPERKLAKRISVQCAKEEINGQPPT